VSLGQAPIHAAVESSNAEIVGTFLCYYQENHLDINVTDMAGWTALHYAACSISDGDTSNDEILRLLLSCDGSYSTHNYKRKTDLEIIQKVCKL
jgi:ankyrin repeat protein